MELEKKMPPAPVQAQPSSRDPERSRRALIQATLDSIAEVGIGETTVSRIIQRAGLSRGMIHLHFRGKENLLIAAAEAFSDHYYTELERQIAQAGGGPADVIKAVIRADLSEAILNDRSTIIWNAFRSAARTNSAIARFSDTRDKRLRHMVREAFRSLLASEGIENADAVANEVTLGTLALLEGMWTDFLAHPNAFSRDYAARIIFRFLNGIVPGRFEFTPPE